MENIKLKSFKDLIIWQKAADLAVFVYSITEKFPKSELYGITNQMRRSVISISSNIAEGFKRTHSKEKLQFYNIAYASTSELESQIEVSYRLNFIAESDYLKLNVLIVEIGKMINGFIKSQNNFPKSYILNSVFFIIFLTSILSPSSLLAVSLTLNSPTSSFMKDEEFLVNFSFDTEGKSINSLQGTINYPVDILEIKEVRDGNSSINFWIEHPQPNTIGSTNFSGIIPGGYRGSNGSLFSIIFKVKNSGKGSITINNIEVLQNDGIATKIKTSIEPFNFSTKKESSMISPTVLFMKEHDAPEAFKAEIGQSQDIFEGRHFITFATQDKGSGIDHYEVKEGFFGTYINAVSPYILENQNLNKKIYIKAIDKDGNKKIELVTPANWNPWYNNYFVVLLFILGICWALSFVNTKLITRKI